MAMSLAKRLKLALEVRAMRQSELARQLHVHRANVSDWCRGITKTMDGAILLRVAEILSISPAWLASGYGDMDPPPSAHAQDSTEDENDLLPAWRWLTQVERSELLAIIQAKALQHKAAAEERSLRVAQRKMAHPAYIERVAVEVIQKATGKAVSPVPDEEVAAKLFPKASKVKSKKP